MKQLIPLIVISILLAACVPQATATPTATASLTATSAPTKTPIPTPTLHPNFIALQEAIAASGERFTLDGATGLIYDGEDPVSGITVSADGTIALEIDGETITPDPDAVNFDDQEGITVEDNERKLQWGENGWEEVTVIPEYIAEMKLVTDPKLWRNAPVVKLEDLPALAKELEERRASGELTTKPPSDRFVPFSYNPSGFRNMGVGMILNPIVGDPRTLYAQDDRWYSVDSLYRTESGSVLSHVVITQKDKTLGGFFTVSNPQAINILGQNGFLRYISGGNDGKYYSIGDVNNEDGCRSILSEETGFCEYYLAHREEYLSLYKQWADRGIVPGDFASGRKIVFLVGQAVKK
ncbi:MAG: hypothetical protein QY306_17635 [Anaerolineales bacterium]|nr:MAG: hypothetical protein QY306_17635 [Anaerolineales bacterium]